jgi:hypothetical protein
MEVSRMHEIETTTNLHLEAVLEGGPLDIPPGARRCRAPFDSERIKLQHQGGYEHFERSEAAPVTGGEPTVYRWVARTRIAE